jgi:tetrahydromethanopterin S-methyltransferase subunit H
LCMLSVEREHKSFQIGRVKIGGKPGQVPTVLIGSIFYNKHHVVKDEMKGEFDRGEAERLIKLQEEFSEKTGNPHMIDVVGSTTEALCRYLDFVVGVTQAPILLDGITPGVRIGALDYVRDHGLTDRIVYNSLLLDYKKEELEKIREIGIKSAILLALNTKEFTSLGKVKAVRELLPIATSAGIEKPLIDTAVIDIPSLGMACRAISNLRQEFGLPVGSGAHNAIDTWKGLKKKMGVQARDPSLASACAITVASGANFVLYGPIDHADYVFPAIGLVDAAFAQLIMEERAMPDSKHPIFKIA